MAPNALSAECGRLLKEWTANPRMAQLEQKADRLVGDLLRALNDVRRIERELLAVQGEIIDLEAAGGVS